MLRFESNHLDAFMDRAITRFKRQSKWQISPGLVAGIAWRHSNCVEQHQTSSSKSQAKIFDVQKSLKRTWSEHEMSMKWTWNAHQILMKCISNAAQWHTTERIINSGPKFFFSFCSPKPVAIWAHLGCYTLRLWASNITVPNDTVISPKLL